MAYTTSYSNYWQGAKMDWEFLRGLLKGTFLFSGNILQSLLTYAGILSFIYLLFPKLEGKMKDKLEKIRNHKLNILLIFLLASVIFTSYNLYHDKSPKFATPSELSAKVLSDLNIRATDLVPMYSEPIVSGKVFENCTFYGPSVWSMRENLVAEVGGTLSVVAETGVSPDTAIIATLNEEWGGVIIFDGNVFKGNNKLHNISIIAGTDKAEQMRNELRISFEKLNKQ
jgi:hypothetical protein